MQRLFAFVSVLITVSAHSLVGIPQVLATPSTVIAAHPGPHLTQPEAALLVSEGERSKAYIMPGKLSANSVGSNPNISSPTIEDIKRVAKLHQATLVEYSINYDSFLIDGKQVNRESDLLIWVIQPTGEVALKNVDLKPLWQKQNISLQELVNNSHNEIRVRSTKLKGGITTIHEDSPNQSLHQLYQLLIEPISDLLPTDRNARVIFIPQQSLFMVSFPALQDKNDKYLIEQHTISTAPSIQVLDLLYQQKQRIAGVTKDVLVVGNPTIPRAVQQKGESPCQCTSIMPGAEQEALSIAHLYNTQALIGNFATKAAVMKRLPQARIIHLATITCQDEVRGGDVPGIIALAPEGKDNGWLSASEIMNMKLNAELVVLSGGDSARGRINSDGVVGLTRSFMVAGVPSAIGSLGSVPDMPTATLMIEFYRNLQQNPDKASALRQAMLVTMKKYPAPSNWADFTLIGEP